MRRGRSRKLWKDGSNRRMNSEFRGGVGPRSCNQILKSIHPISQTRTRRPQLVGDRRNNYFHASLRSRVAQAFLSQSLSLCLSVCLSVCLSLSLSLSFPLPPPPRPSSGTVCLLARFQVNQRQIQGRAQPNFGPLWKPWPGPHFYLSRNGRPLTIGLSASDGSS